MVQHVAELAVDPARAVVFEHGWQSWSPTGAYRLDERPHRPATAARLVMNYRPGRVAPADAWSGEGLLAIDPGGDAGGGETHVFAAPSPAGRIPSIEARLHGRDRLVVTADGPVDHETHEGGVDAALARWADGFAARAGVGALRPAPTMWCSWYHYFTRVSEADVVENLQALDDLELGVDVVQLDDGYQSAIGDWLTLSDRFSSIPSITARVRDTGRRAGIWVAPFLVSPTSDTAKDHPEWLVGDVEAGGNWGEDLRVLDVTHPGAREWLHRVFATLAAAGVDLFKIDFVYAGAMDGRRHDPDVTGVDAYREGLRVVRDAIGPDAYLLGCGAPILPSVGLVDAMRVSPDIAAHYEPLDGDQSQPSQRAAARNSRSRAWQHGRFWVNDSDCLLAAPTVERRDDWAAVVESCGGLRASSDRLRDLDEHGLATTRRLVRPVPATPFDTWAAADRAAAAGAAAPADGSPAAGQR